MHLADATTLNVNDSVDKGTYIAMEGSTGQSTGIHLHVEMQNINRFNNSWHSSYIKSEYIDPTVYMGIDNIENTQWLYNGIPKGHIQKRHKFNWILFKKRKELSNTQIYKK